MTSTLGIKKIQYPNGTNSITIDSSGSADITTANITTANVTNATATGTITTPSINGSQISGRRNIVINGAMKVAQRSTSTTSSNGYGVDRFRGNVGHMDELVQTLAQNSVTDLPGFTKSLKATTTTGESSIASNELFREMYFIEGQDLQQLKYGTSDAETITLSFYVKSTVTGTFAVSIYADSNSRMIGGTYTINSTNTWEKKTLSFAGDTGSVIDNDNTEGLRINWILAAGSDYTSANNTSWGAYSGTKLGYGHVTNSVITTTNASWEITGVQLEVGSQATPFEHRSFGEEQNLCQRYFYKFVNTGLSDQYNFYSPYSPAQVNAGLPNTSAICPMTFPVTMRAAPTVTTTISGGSLNRQTSTPFGFVAQMASTSTGTHYITQYLANAEL